MMLNQWDALRRTLPGTPRTWVVTGAAGFIGSHLLEHLLKLGQRTVAVDNLSTGFRSNYDDVRAHVGAAWSACRIIEGDIRDPAVCADACQGADVVLHQAALGSVPRSMKDPLLTTSNNVDGTVAVFTAARDAGVKRVVFASSSSVYGDSPELPKREEQIGRPLSPYALSKRVNEEHADLFRRAFGMSFIGLRYFNVFGPRQSPEGAYAAVIPRWFERILAGEPIEIYGDGETSRDFCFVDNVVQANLLAATTADSAALDRVYNVACADRTTLKELFLLIRDESATFEPSAARASAKHLSFREGDVRHSLADIGNITRLLGYSATHDVRQGIAVSARWYYAFRDHPRSREVDSSSPSNAAALADQE